MTDFKKTIRKRYNKLKRKRSREMKTWKPQFNKWIPKAGKRATKTLIGKRKWIWEK